jgi:asparagine synthase (glutamine-hydrolysing)
MAFLALTGWPAAEPPADAWRTQLGELPVALASEQGTGFPVFVATSADGRLHAAVTGEIANRRELDDAVGRGPAIGMPRNDAALVLRLYEGRGEQSVSALRGAFALALWDGRRGRLLLARDQLGVRTLFYAAGRGHCAASPRLPLLLRIPGLAGAPDLEAVDVTIALGDVPAPATAYPGIRQLRPGELLLWEPGRLRTQRYWQLRFPEGREGRRTVVGEAVRRIREQLEEALRIRTAGRVAGLLLSDGLGASALLALATTIERRPVTSLTVAGHATDVGLAAALAQRARVVHEATSPDVDWAAAADRALALHGAPVGGMDEPMLTAAAHALAARTRLLLVGVGAEEVPGGAPAERLWAACERYRALPGLLREGVDILAVAGWPRRLARAVAVARSAPADVFAAADLALGSDKRQALYGPELRHSSDVGPAERAVGSLVADAVSQGASVAGDVLYAVRLALGIPRRAARLATALASTAEVSFPLIDPRIAQMSAAVPPRLRTSRGRRAWLLSEALAAELPHDVQRAPHRPLEPPAQAWRASGLRAVVDDVLEPDRVAKLGLFDPAAVARLRSAHDAGRFELGALLWRLVLVTRWLEAPARAARPLDDTPPAAAPARAASASS